jgi:hypothetical protein
VASCIGSHKIALRCLANADAPDAWCDMPLARSEFIS